MGKVSSKRCHSEPEDAVPTKVCKVPHESNLDGLQTYRVEPKRLQTSEYRYEASVDFKDKKIKDNLSREWLIIITALINTAGGLFTFTTEKAVDSTTTDEWTRGFYSKLNTVLPEIVRSKCIEIEPKGNSTVHVVIKPSKHMITYDYHLFTRHVAENHIVSNIEEAAAIIEQESSAPTQLPEYEFRYNSPVQFGEKSNIEFKFFENVKTGEDIFQKFQNQARKCIFAFPNMPTGGRLFIGINENKREKCTLVLGQTLPEDDEKGFTEAVDRYLRQDRIWNSEGMYPSRGGDWDVFYHLVKGCPDNERRVVIEIMMGHFPGGVFIHKPEAYFMKQDGSIEQKTFHDWKTEVRKYGTVKPSGKLPSTHHVTPAPVILPKPSSDLTSKSKQAFIQDLQPSERLHGKSYLSWSRDNAEWKNDLIPGNTSLQDALCGLRDSLMPSYPMMFIPLEQSIINSSPEYSQDIEKCIKLIKEWHGPQKGVAIAGKGILKMLSDVQLPEPPHHLVDIMSLDMSSKMKSTSIFKKRSVSVGHQEQQQTYTWQLARLLKFLILTEPQHRCENGQSLYIQSDVWFCEEKQTIEEGILCDALRSINSKSPKLTKLPSLDSICSKKFTAVPSQFQNIQQRLCTLFLERESPLKRTIGDECLVHLSAEQMRVLLGTDISQFNLIDGPPGSGKTLLASYVIKHLFQPGDCLTLVRNPCLKSFLVSKRIDYVEVMNDKSDLISVLTKPYYKDLKCLVIDDCHNIDLTTEQWLHFFSKTYSDGKHVFVFMDNHVQNFQSTANESIEDAFHQLKKTHPGLLFNRKTLREVHRNTKKIVSFLSNTAASIPNMSGGIVCSHDVEGDDVELLQLPNIFSKVENGLLKFVEQTICPKKQLAGDVTSYDAREIAILVDGSRAEEVVRFYRRLLKGHLRNVAIQDASIFPRKGIVVDHLDNFSGLDSRMVIFVHTDGLNATSDESSMSARGLHNPKYKAFVASRGVYKVVFVTEDELTYGSADLINIDQEKLAEQLRSRETYCEISRVPVVGMQHYGYPSLVVGNEYFLRPEPDNDVDKFAVVVEELSASTRRAYLRKEWAAEIQPILLSKLVIPRLCRLRVDHPPEFRFGYVGEEHKCTIKLACNVHNKRELLRKLNEIQILFAILGLKYAVYINTNQLHNMSS